MTSSQWPWFEFPYRKNWQEEMFTLFELHAGRAFIKFNTAVPDHPSVALLQVVTFLDPEGQQRLFSENARMQFEALAKAFHASLVMSDLDSLMAIANERRIVAGIMGAGEEELFLLSPASFATALCSQIDGVVEDFGALSLLPDDGAC
jgi:hypothetical protein